MSAEGTRIDPAGAVARDVFGWGALRENQRRAIETVVTGRDTLAIMPTGAGKSAIYQVAGIIMGGLTVVVSPLVALQQDQIESLRRHVSAPLAVSINSSRTHAARDAAWRSIDDGRAGYVFLSPEQLERSGVIERLRRRTVVLFVVDEAHIVSEWGHDFRPDYLTLSAVVAELGRPPVLALTATASPPVRMEIVRSLDMTDPLVLLAGFDRPNIDLRVARYERDRDKRAALVERAARQPGAGLIYVATRADAELYAEALGGLGRSAASYHAGLTAKLRREVGEKFASGATDIVVATSAFGMGIDRADVRFVLHAAPPESLDAYDQEIGRSGRDGTPAIAELFYRAADIGLQSFFAHRSVRPAVIDRLFASLDAVTPVSVRAIAAELGATEQATARQINLLRDAGLVSLTEVGVRLVTGVTPGAAEDGAEAAAARRQHIDASHVVIMRSYAEARVCRRQFLLGYFGEVLQEPCGNCDICRRDALNSRARMIPTVKPGTRARHATWGSGVVVSSDRDRITVYFEQVGYKVIATEDAEQRGFLALG